MSLRDGGKLLACASYATARLMGIWLRSPIRHPAGSYANLNREARWTGAPPSVRKPDKILPVIQRRHWAGFLSAVGSSKGGWFSVAPCSMFHSEVRKYLTYVRFVLVEAQQTLDSRRFANPLGPLVAIVRYAHWQTFCMVETHRGPRNAWWTSQ